MMREFMAYEYVDGDLKLYVKGEDDSAWRELGTIPFEHRRFDTAAALVGPMTEVEKIRLEGELAWPRRW